MFHFDLFGTFQDMAWTGIHYEKWLRGDYRVGVWFLCCALLLAGQGTGLTDKAVTICFPLLGGIKILKASSIRDLNFET